ncbi:50S ribosomal protein L21 [Desulfococcaceae bacterium HSG9]|nr:50S ribosomal protein L21 [Desulfococcaceae bacterium HSG9]
MYAIIGSGGKQYRTEEGEFVRVEKLAGEVGDEIIFDKVLMFADGENVNIGRPLLEDVAVKGHIIEQGKYRKIIVFKYKRRKRYRRKQGHRQRYTAVRIDSIGAKASESSEAAEVEDA